MPLVLRFLAGPRAGETVPLPDGQAIEAGRDAQCALALGGANVSRIHARLVAGPDGVAVENLSSTNGVYLNGVQRRQGVLQRWDTLVIGPHVLRIEDEESGLRPAVPTAAVHDHGLAACLLEIQRLLSEDGERIIERSLEALFVAIPATRLALFTVGADGEPVQGATALRASAAPARLSQGFARQVLRAGRAVLLEAGLETAAGSWGDTLQQQAVRTVLGVPVQHGGSTVAVLLCDNLEEPGRLDQSHVGLLEFAGRALANVFQRDELRRSERERLRTEGEMRAGQRVQQQLFTQDPATIPGPLRWAATYHPALELGGDYWDFSDDAAGTTWLVADVSGKGIPAALVVSMLKTACKALRGRGLGPADLLGALHGLLRGEMPVTMFFTALAVRAARDGTVTWCGVGHPPGILLAADGTPRRLESMPGVLGMAVADALVPRLADREERLGSGGRLCMFTDGLVEAMGADGAFFDLPRIEAVLAATRDQPPAGAMAALIAAVQAHTGGASLADDITLVVGEHPG